ncbi:MAG: hypothetical protein AB1384_06900 [Actinomycetota bacterium]
MDGNRISEDDLGNFCRRITPVLQAKYNRQPYSGRIDGYGKIFLG